MLKLSFKNISSCIKCHKGDRVVFNKIIFIATAAASTGLFRKNKRNYAQSSWTDPAEETVQWQKLTKLIQGVAQNNQDIVVFIEHRGYTWVSFSKSYRHLTTARNVLVGRESRSLFSKLTARGWTPLEDEVLDSLFTENLRLQQPVGLVIYVIGSESMWQRRGNLEFVQRYRVPLAVVKPQNLQPFPPGTENQAYLILNTHRVSGPFLLDLSYFLRGLASFYHSKLSAGSFVSERFRNEAAFYDIRSRWVSLMRGLVEVRRAKHRRVRYKGRKVLQRR